MLHVVEHRLRRGPLRAPGWDALADGGVNVPLAASRRVWAKPAAVLEDAGDGLQLVQRLGRCQRARRLAERGQRPGGCRRRRWRGSHASSLAAALFGGGLKRLPGGPNRVTAGAASARAIFAPVTVGYLAGAA